MINKQSATEAIELARLFDQKGYLVSAEQTSPIQKLNAASQLISIGTPVGMDPAQLSQLYNPTGDSIELQTSTFGLAKDESGNNAHEVLMDSFVQTVSENAANHIAYARNVIRPAIDEYHAMVTGALKEFGEDLGYNPKIIKKSLPAPMLAPSIRETIESYGGDRSRPPSNVFSLSTLSDDEIVSLIKTGNELIDSDIDIWLHSVSPNLLQVAYRAAFVNEEGYGNRFNAVVVDPKIGVDAAFVIFMIAQKYIENPVENSNMSLIQWRQSVEALSRESGMYLKEAYKTFDLYTKTQMLTIASSSEGIVVFEPVFDRYVAEGGSLTCIFGSALTSPIGMSRDNVVANSEKFQEAWARENAMRNRIAMNNRASYARSALTSQFDRILDTHFDTYLAYLKERGVSSASANDPTLTNIRASFIKAITAYDLSTVTDFWNICMEALTKSIFAHTNAYEMFSFARDLREANPSLTPKEAMLLSEQEILVDHFVDQLVIAKL